MRFLNLLNRIIMRTSTEQSKMPASVRAKPQRSGGDAQVQPRRLGLSILMLLVVCSLVGCGPHSDQEQAQKSSQPTIVFMTDFGTANDAVAICKAVIVGIA